MNIISIGYFKEMPYGKENSPSIKEAIGKVEKEYIDKIYEYLSSGIILVASPGVATDVINPDVGEIGTLSAMTDGIWLWPGELAYYVKNYGIELPDEFIETMKNNNWSINFKLEDIIFDSFTIDGVNPFDT